MVDIDKGLRRLFGENWLKCVCICIVFVSVFLSVFISEEEKKNEDSAEKYSRLTVTKG